MRTHLVAVVALLIILTLSFLTYFKDYSYPAAFFWDENYHIAAAQKYLNGIYFMEPHPPLGKLLIAAGEYLLKSNSRNDQFVRVDHAKQLPPNFSLKGYRFLPALMAWLTAPILYLIFLLIMKNPLQSFFLTLLYVFDNALIVHSRGAMLEGPQLFFMCLTISLALLAIRAQEKGRRRIGAFLFFVLGMAFSGTVLVKLNGLVLILLAVPLIFNKSKEALRNALSLLGFGFTGFFLLFVFTWYAHFRIAERVQPNLPNHGYYQASDQYKSILEKHETGNITFFPLMLRDSFQFIHNYEKGVEALNLCKREENGSPPFLWPFGGRAINYRWESSDDKIKYLYLQCNPFVWVLGLIGFLGCSSFLITSCFFGIRFRLRDPVGISTLVAMYMLYMGVMFHLNRVMYLYHYFIPLVISMILFAHFITEMTCIGRRLILDQTKTQALAVLSIPIIIIFGYYSRLSYYQPISKEDLQELAWLSFWDLRCPNCPLTNKFAQPIGDPRIKYGADLFLSGVKVGFIMQDWGDPRSDYTVTGQELIVAGNKYRTGFGVHANSLLEFNLNKKYSIFKAYVGLPDYIAKKGNSSVRFQVLGDHTILWQSSVMRAADPPELVEVDINGVALLSLKVKAEGDSIDNAHACWLKPELY